MKRIARNLCVRSDVALQTAEFALVEVKMQNLWNGAM